MSGFTKPLLAACGVASLLLCGRRGAARAQTPACAGTTPAPAHAAAPSHAPAPRQRRQPRDGSVALPEVEVDAPKP